MSAANPYAGITQIRFKGSLLSPYGHPLFSVPSLLLYFSKIKYFLSDRIASNKMLLNGRKILHGLPCEGAHGYRPERRISLKSARRSRQPSSSRWRMGPVSHTISLASSIIAVKAPLDVVADKLLHQFRLMGVEKTSDCFRKNILLVAKPSLVHKGHGLVYRASGTSV